MNLQTPDLNGSDGGRFSSTAHQCIEQPFWEKTGADKCSIVTGSSSCTSPLSSRAREILDSLREQRESLLGKWNDGSDDKATTTAAFPLKTLCSTTDVPLKINDESVVVRLHESLQRERNSRLSRMHQRFPPPSPLSVTSCSLDESDAAEKRSVETRSTVTTVTSSSIDHLTSPGSQSSTSISSALDGAFTDRKSIGMPSVPSLQELGSVVMEPDSSLAQFVSPRANSRPSVATSVIESMSLVHTHEQQLADADAVAKTDPDKGESSHLIDDPELLRASCLRLIDHDDTCAAMENPCTPTATSRDFVSRLPASLVISPLTPVKMDASVRPDKERAQNGLSLHDVDIPLELSPIDKRSIHSKSSFPCKVNNDSVDSCAASCVCSTLSSSTLSLVTKKERADYIGDTYCKSARIRERQQRLLRSGVSARYGQRRNERNQINRVMVRGRVGIVKSSNQRVFVTEADATRSDLANNNEPRTSYSKKNSEKSIQVENRRRTFSRTRSKMDRSEIVSPTSDIEGSEDSIPDDDTLQSNGSNSRISQPEIRRIKDDAEMATETTLAFQSPAKRSESPLSTTSNSSSDFIAISDDSSFELTSNSDSSEWASITENSTHHTCKDSIKENISIVSGMTMSPVSPLFSGYGNSHNISKNRRVGVGWKVPLLSEMKSPSIDDECDILESTSIVSSANSVLSFRIPFNSNLFVVGRAADSLCFANGGHLSIAKDSGLVLNQTPAQIPLTKLKVTNPTSPQQQSVKLSTDFRCGTRGSLYDIALRSGLKSQEPLPLVKRKKVPTETTAPRNAKTGRGSPKPVSTPLAACSAVKEKSNDKVYIPARGGIYDTALHSGLTRQLLHSRTPFSVTTDHASQYMKHSYRGEIVPESISDRQCGSTGSMLSLLQSSCYPPVKATKKARWAMKEEEDGYEVE